MKMERSRAVERIRANLERHGWPRVQVSLIVALAGLAGFIVSYALLSAGVSSMAARYAVAGVAAYLAFLALIAMWLAWQRNRDLAVDVLEFVDLPSPRVGGPVSFDGFGAGRSGGGGSSGSWGSLGSRGSGSGGSRGSSGSGSSGSGGSWLDGDSDLGWVLLALAALVAGVIAIGYVIWIAPALLAEVLVDATIVSAVARSVTRVERRDWTATVLRRTWLPATALILAVVVAGYALQRMAPDARSIGPAVQTILQR